MKISERKKWDWEYITLIKKPNLKKKIPIILNHSLPIHFQIFFLFFEWKKIQIKMMNHPYPRWWTKRMTLDYKHRIMTYNEQKKKKIIHHFFIQIHKTNPKTVRDGETHHSYLFFVWYSYIVSTTTNKDHLGFLFYLFVWLNARVYHQLEWIWIIVLMDCHKTK